MLIGLIAGDMRAGGGFGATNIYRLGADTFRDKCFDKSIPVILPNSISASISALATNSISIDGADVTNNPNAVVSIREFGTIRTIPIAENVTDRSRAYTYASVLPYWYSINKSILPCNSTSAALTFVSWSCEILRNAVNRSISAVRSRASAAFWSASAARTFASAIFSSDSRFSFLVSIIARNMQYASIAKAIPIRASADIPAVISQSVSSGRRKYIVLTASRTTPIRIANVALADQRSRASKTSVGVLFLFWGALDDNLLGRRKKQLIAFAIFSVLVLMLTAWLS